MFAKRLGRSRSIDADTFRVLSPLAGFSNGDAGTLSCNCLYSKEALCRIKNHVGGALVDFMCEFLFMLATNLDILYSNLLLYES